VKRRLILIGVAIGLALAFVLPWLLDIDLSHDVHAQGPDGYDTYYVAPDATCGDKTPCFGDVQEAVDAVDDPDDVVKVAAGTYTGVAAREDVTQVAYISKTLTIRGGYTTTNWLTADPKVNLTTLDAQGQGRVFYVTGDISPTIEGLSITGGDASGLGGGYFGFDCGGGVYLDHFEVENAATLSNNRVYSNTAQVGGGLCLYYGTPSLDGNVILSNTAGSSGGGVWLDRSEATLTDNTIALNTAEQGGGLYFLWTGVDTLNGNLILSNTANTGGGLYLDEVPARLSNTVIRGNTASGTNWWQGGGGVHMRVSAATFTNCLVADNHSPSGGGVKMRGSSPRFLHTTIARNTGGGGVHVRLEGVIYASNAVLTNTILVSHSVGISVTEGNTVTVNGVLWHDTPITVSRSITTVVTVKNQRTGDPVFAVDGYHLTAGSAAIDGGVPSVVTADIDGDRRPIGAEPDLGADEAWRWINLPLITRRGP
jgi:hypothetical protein